MPTPRAKDDASEHSMAPSSVSKRSSQCPKQASGVPASRHASVQHGTQTEGNTQPQTHPMEEFKKNRKVQALEVTCNSCITRVKGRDALGHLFFGRLKCANCMFVISHCERFKKCYPVISKCAKTQQPHTLTHWVRPVWNYLIYCARRDTAITGFYENDKSDIGDEVMHDKMASYLRALLPLKDILPWKSAFTDPSLETIMKTKVLVSEPQKSEPKSKVVQQNQTQVALQASPPLTRAASHAAPEVSLQKSNIVQKRDNQQNTPRKQEDHNKPPVTTHTTKTLRDIKIQAEARKTFQESTVAKADECNKMKHKDPPPAAKVPEKSTPKERKTQQSSTKDTDKDIKYPPVTTHAAKALQRDIEVEEKATKALQLSTVVKADECSKMKHKDLPLATHISEKSTPKERKAQQSHTEDTDKNSKDPPPATQVSEKSTPKKRKALQSSTEDTDEDISMANSTLKVTKRTPEFSEENSSDLSLSKLSKRRRKPGKRKKKPYQDIIPKIVLHSMNYLVLQLSPQLCLKECPNCYTALSAEMCYVNISTCVVHLMCPSCDLAVYVVPEELYCEPA